MLLIDRFILRAISARLAIALAIAGCTTLCAFGSLANAQVTASEISSDASDGIALSPSAAGKKPHVKLSPKKINFGKVPAGAHSSPQTVTFTNESAVELAAPQVSVSTGFSADSTGCMSTIPPAGSCPVSVTFTPTKKGKFKHGLLKFTDAAAKSPQKVKLIGIGLPPSPTATPTATATSTATPTVTATPTTTASPTATATASPTVTASSTATKTATATATSTATATTTATATATPTATETPVFNVAFVTSTPVPGNFGGQTAADTICTNLAAAANLPSGTYKAWLSTSGLNAVTKMGSARGFIRTDGAPFADQVSDIVAGKIFHALNLNENGGIVDNDVWTGTTNAGATAAKTCSDWTSNSGSVGGEVGFSPSGPSDWSDLGGNIACNNVVPLYCFDTSHDTALTVTAVSGRIAFVSKTAFDPSSGVSGADTLCQTEAANAGLANPSNYLALLSTSMASAASRFDLSAMSAPYVRPDGIKIADAPTIAAGTGLDSGIWQNADGTYVTGLLDRPWTGSSTPSITPMDTDTCMDWTSKAAGVDGIIGDSSTVGGNWWNSNALGFCSIASEPLYCLEQ
jgi:Cep192 domain 4